ncbi:Beta-propeller repeat protein [compost metagenome]
MKSIFLFLSFLLAVLNTRAQDVRLEWVKGMFAPHAIPYDINTDKQGNVYTAGTYFGPMDADPGPGVYLLDGNGFDAAYVTKFNASGQLQWARSFASVGSVSDAFSVAADGSGNVYVAGYFSATTDFDPGPGVYNLDPLVAGFTFVVKLNSNGDFVWVKSFTYGYPVCIEAAESGSLYIGIGSGSGSFDLDPGPGIDLVTPNGGNALLMCKLDAAGNYVWGRNMVGSVTKYQYFSLDENGHIYMTGYFTGIKDFDPGPGVYNLAAAYTCTNMCVAKWDTAGNFIWAKSMGGQTGTNHTVMGTSVKADAQGNVIVGGHFNGIIDFDPGLGIYNLTAIPSIFTAMQPDMHITKLDVNGNFIWAKAMGGKRDDGLVDLDIDSAGSIYSTGLFKDTVDFDPGPGVHRIAAHDAVTGASDIFVHKLNASGALEWIKIFGAGGDELVGGIALDTAASIYTTGILHAAIDFDPDTPVYNLTDTTWGHGGFVHKMSAVCPTSGGAPTLSSSTLTIICPDTTANINSLVTSTRPAGIVLQWFTNNTHTGTPYATPAAATSGTYYAFYYDAVNNCYSPPTVVTVNNGGTTNTPLFDAIDPLCSGVIASPLPTTATNNITGSWSPAWNNAATTTYTFTPAPGQCAVPVTKTVVIKQVTYGTHSVSICEGNSYLFNGQQYTTANNTAKDTLTNAVGCDSIITLNLTVVPVNPVTINEQLEGCGSLRYKGQYYYTDTVVSDTLLSRLGCDSVYNIAAIKVYPQNPTIISIDTFACKRLTLNGVVYTQSVYVQDTLRTVHGCDSIIRHINIDIVNFDLDAVATVSNPYEGEFVYINTSSATGQTYEITKWQPAALFADQTAYTNNFKALAPGMVNVLVAAVGRHNCADSVTIPIQVRAYDPKIILPNAFTPNGDGRNDVFIPQLNIDRAYTFLEFNVYNRWGQVLYSTSNVNAGWDGSSKGVLQEQGVYYYTIKVRLLNNDIRSFSGELTLLK